MLISRVDVPVERSVGFFVTTFANRHILPIPAALEGRVDREEALVTGIYAISGVINGLTLPAREKKELQAEILRLVYEREREMIEARAGVIRAEAAGNWLQRSWRPLVMLIFAVIVLIGTFTSLPMLADTSRFWDLLEIGLGGYVVGRSGEIGRASCRERV